MLAYMVRRLLWVPFLLGVVVFVTFTLGYYGPGGPEVVFLGQRYDPEIAAVIRQQWGLDDSFGVQYLRYLRNYVSLNFGESLVKFPGQPISRLIGQRLQVTLELNIAAALIGVPLGIFMGIFAAVYRGSWLDRFIVFNSVLLSALPVFVLIPVLRFIFVLKLDLVPAGGWDGIFSATAILPVLVLSTGSLSGWARQTRAGMLEVLRTDYIRTARAKGLAEMSVLIAHALRNAFIPLLTFLGFLLGGLVQGTLLTETLFGIPGMGQLFFESLSSRDYPIILALTVLVAITFALANLWVDLMYGLVDPRIRSSQG
jgi:ABC-type dipeptide/oligopeptide/nickel transport system permease component